MKATDKNSLEVGIYFIPEPIYNKHLPFILNMPTELKPIELSGDATYNDVAILIASLLTFNDMSFESKFFKALAEPHELALVGGLGFRKNNSYIGPSCCSEFQDWRGIKSSLANKANYWMGHNPDPYFDFSGSNVVLWNDELGTSERFSIEFSIHEFRLAEMKAQKKLRDFTILAKEWAQSAIHSQAELFTTGIEDYLLNSHHYK